MNHMMNKIGGRNYKYLKLVRVIILLLAITLYTSTTFANEENLSLYAQSAVLMDGESGRILYSEDGDLSHANASTTKILTCILALEYGDMTSIVEASSVAASQPAVHMGVIAGERYYLEDMLYALMLESYNDSAVIIAEGVSGSVESFVALMNEKAWEIGCEDTYFITPNGLDAEDDISFHHTTASDLALIMKYCIMESPMKEEFLEITQTLSYSFQDIDGTRFYSCSNRNTLLQTNEDAVTGKTGFTNNAGYCYVGVIENEGRTFIVALLGCGWPYNTGYKWLDCKTLFDYGLENYFYETIDTTAYSKALEESVLSQIPVEGGKTLEEQLFVDLQVAESSTVTVLKKEEEEIQVKVDYSSVLYAPLLENTLVGSVSYYLDDILLGVEGILVEETIEEETWNFLMYKKLLGVISVLLF